MGQQEYERIRDEAHAAVVSIHAERGLGDENKKNLVRPFLLVPEEQADLSDWITADDRRMTQNER